MNYLLVEQLSKSFGEKELFSDITFGIDQGSKVALIARNGAGKTSLLNIITGKDLPDSGRVVFRNDIRWAYLEQNPEMDPAETVFNVLFNSTNASLSAIREYEECLHLLKHDDSKELQKRLEDAAHQMEVANAWDYDNRIKEILSRFSIDDLSQPTGSLSGGQRKKVALAKALLEESDLLILDEPTNHLDVEMIEWLEEYLSRQALSLLIVTHDRYFLDNVCNEIIELDNNQLYRYKGNYSYFIGKKAEREAIEQLETEKAQNLYRKELDWMRRMPQARTTKSKARIDAFYDLKEKAKRKLAQDSGDFKVKMNRIGGKVLELNNIHKSFGELKVIDDFSYIFKKGERIGIVGRNGSGKTTLLNILTGRLRPDAGKVTTGQTIVQGYYSQEGLQPREDKRVIDIVKEVAEQIPVGKGYMSASAFLNHFNFPHTLQYAYFSSLSGGERRRLFLLMQLIKNPNFLILDEPTNDLDIHTLNLLEDFLLNFEGCLLIVSHDRFFMDKLVDHIFVFGNNGRIKDYWGNYTEYYRQKLKEEKALQRESAKVAEQAVKPKKANPSEAKPTYKQKTEFDQLERDIAALETEKEEIITLMNSGTLHDEALREKGTRYETVEKLLEEKTDRWMELAALFE